MFSAKDQKEKYERSKAFLSAGSVDAKDVNNLRELLKFHEWKYYVQNDPVISDFEYDHLYKMLESIEHKHPDLITPDSPTQRVASDLNADFDPVTHLVPMLSLDNSYNADDLLDFDKQIKKLNIVQ